MTNKVLSTTKSKSKTTCKSKSKLKSKNEIVLSSTDLEAAVSNILSAAKSKRKGVELISINNKNSAKSKTKLGNELTEMMPGYVAPMSLDSSALDAYKQPSSSSISTASTTSSASVSNNSNNDDNFTSKNFKLSKPNPQIKLSQQSNAGSSWFNFQATPNSSSLQADISIIRNRNYINPKKFYKSSDFGKKSNSSRHSMVQLGTVIEGSMESVATNRLSKKQQKSTFLEEVMGDVFGSKDDYVKKKFTSMQKEKDVLAKKQQHRSRKSTSKFRGNFKKRR